MQNGETLRLKAEKELPRRTRVVSEGRDVRVGRWRVPEREAPARSMAVTRRGGGEQVTPRHAHGDGASGSQSERKARGSEETWKCLKRMRRFASDASDSASAGVTATNKVIRRRELITSVGDSSRGDHDMFLLRYGLALFIWGFSVSASWKIND